MKMTTQFLTTANVRRASLLPVRRVAVLFAGVLLTGLGCERGDPKVPDTQQITLPNKPQEPTGAAGASQQPVEEEGPGGSCINFGSQFVTKDSANSGWGNKCCKRTDDGGAQHTVRSASTTQWACD